MPTGWTTTDDDGDDDGSDFCPELNLDQGIEALGEAEANFQASETGPFLSHAVGVYEIDVAMRAIDRVRDALESCRDFTTKNDDGSKTKGRLRPLSLPNLGDETIALKMSFESKGFVGSGDMIITRVDNAVSLLFVVGFDASIFGATKVDQR